MHYTARTCFQILAALAVALLVTLTGQGAELAGVSALGLLGATEILSERYSAYVHSHASATTAKTPLLLANKPVIPLNNAGASEANVFVYRADKVRVPKATGEAWTPGAKIYFDANAGKFTTTSTDNTIAGIVVEAAANGATEGVIDLDPAIT